MTLLGRISPMLSSESHMCGLFEIIVVGGMPRDLLRLPEIVEWSAAKSEGIESTLLVCRLRDDAELRGFLSRLWDLDLGIESVRRDHSRDREEEKDGRDTDP
jgi:hypothetical protein